MGRIGFGKVSGNEFRVAEFVARNFFVGVEYDLGMVQMCFCGCFVVL